MDPDAGEERQAQPLQPPEDLPGPTPNQYRYQIFEHASKTSAKNSLFAGQQFRELVQFLRESPTYPNGTTPSLAPSQEEEEEDEAGPFALLYKLEENTRSFPEPQLLAFPLPKLFSYAEEDASGNNGALIFLRGYPSPDWLMELGANYHIDPEFFRRHMTYLKSDSDVGCPPSTLLSSSQKTIFQISITSLGRQDAEGYSSISAKRTRADVLLDEYMRSLQNPAKWSCCDSVVRSYSAHDLCEFSIQQIATVTVFRHRSRRDRWVAIVWLDSARNVSRSPKGPWVSGHRKWYTTFEPIALFRPNVSLKQHWHADIALPDYQDGDAVQSLETLPFVYGRSLNPKAASHDPFYALNELLTFTAISEMAFLSAIERKLHQNFGRQTGHDNDALLNIQADLVYYRQVLEEHLTNVSDTRNFIKSRIYLDWPRYNDRQVESAAIWLQNDFEQLVEKATLLQRRCEREMDVLLTYASLKEAKQSSIQSERGVRLTILGSFFIPLAFSASLFGMNFVTFKSRGEGTWVWILVTIPVFIISVLVIGWDEQRVAMWFNRLRANTRARKQQIATSPV